VLKETLEYDQFESANLVKKNSLIFDVKN